jgi:hypothetical protein
VLFGPPDEGNLLADLKLPSFHSASSTSSSDGKTFAEKIFEYYFEHEIEQQLKVESRWANRAPPKPLNLKTLLKGFTSLFCFFSLLLFLSRPSLPHPYSFIFVFFPLSLLLQICRLRRRKATN